MDTCQSLQFGCLHLQVTLPACSASPETQLQMQPPNRSDTNIPLMHAAGASPAGCSSVQLPAHPSLAHGPAYPPVEVRSRRSCQLMLDSWPTQCTAKHGAVHVLQVPARSAPLETGQQMVACWWVHTSRLAARCCPRQQHRHTPASLAGCAHVHQLITHPVYVCLDSRTTDLSLISRPWTSGTQCRCQLPNRGYSPAPAPRP
jgi:hypothetical protein